MALDPCRDEFVKVFCTVTTLFCAVIVLFGAEIGVCVDLGLFGADIGLWIERPIAPLQKERAKESDGRMMACALRLIEVSFAKEPHRNRSRL